MPAAARDPVALLIDYHAAINVLDFITIESMFAKNAVYVSGGVGGRIDGREPIMAAFRSYFHAFPDQIAVDTLVEAVGALAARAVWQLTAHDSRTGKQLVRTGEETVTFDAAGRILRVDVTDY